MTYFDLGIIILFIATVIYYITFFILIFYWRETKTSYIITPILFTFKFFFTGFLLVSAISLILENLPEAIKLIQN